MLNEELEKGKEVKIGVVWRLGRWRRERESWKNERKRITWEAAERKPEDKEDCRSR